MSSRLRTCGLLATFGILLAGSVAAKQIRVTVSGFTFAPATVTINAGDHVVWVWSGGTHNVVSGDGSSQIADGVFTSGSPGSSPATFSWRGPSPTTQPYFCELHAPSMVGTINVVASGAGGLSDFRITEVQFNAAGNLDLIEITNIGAAGNLGRYRLAGTGFTTQNLQIGSGPDLAVPSNGQVVIHCNASGTSTATNLFLPGITDLPATGAIALYVPNTTSTSLANVTQIIDFVQWGAGGQANEPTAVSAGFWASSAAVPAVASGSSIEFCGQPGQYGANYWHENPTPNFGTGENCVVPTFSTSWGRIKTLYR